MLYEKFYAGSSIVVRNQSDREAPWQSFHDTVDRLLASIEVPGHRSRQGQTLKPCRRFEQGSRWAIAPCAAQPGRHTCDQRARRSRASGPWGEDS